MSLLFLMLAIAIPVLIFSAKLAGRVLGWTLGLLIVFPLVLTMGAFKRKKASVPVLNSNVRN